jgi:L-iditol 2-dehydrogenase
MRTAAAAAETARAAVLHGREDLRVEQIPMPRAGAGELVVRVAAALTCGTDLKVFRRGYHARMLTPPALFGHEFAGRVEEAGGGVTAFRPGDRVVALNSAPCGQCYFCRREQENLCDDLVFNNGAYAEFLRVPARIVERNTLQVPDHVPLEHAALTEPLACALHGIEDTGARPGDTLAVIGAGPLGLMLIHLAHLEGLEVIAVVKHAEQARTARNFGADHVVLLSAQPDAVAAVRALTPGGRGVDAAIEAVATPTTWQWAVDMVRKGGVVNFFGGPPAGPRVELDTNRLHYNDLTLKATFHHTPAICRRTFALIASGRVKAADFLTGRARLADIDAVFRRMSGPGRDIKTVIEP